MKTTYHSQGFTLIEMCVSVAVIVVTATLALTGLIHVLRAAKFNDIQNELDVDVQMAMEKLKYNARLSTLEKMFFYPAGGGPYKAVSLPLARDDDGDGAVDKDATGHIVWDKTIIYHVWSGSPEQLRMTVFDPRDNTLTDVQRQAQLNSVVQIGNGSQTYNAANSRTVVVFQNLFSWSITPRGAIYDGYASTEQRAIGVALGSCVLAPGPHIFKFAVTGKNAASSGYGVAIDTLAASPSGSIREGEAQLPVASQSGALAVCEYMPAGSWSGNARLNFPAVGAGNTFSLSLENDAWEDTNFDRSGDTHERTLLVFDKTLSPYEFVVKPVGLTTNWSAKDQTGDATGAAGAADALKGCAVRVLLRGEEMPGGSWLTADGARSKVLFRSGASGALAIQHAYIGECESRTTNTPDVVPGTQVELQFAGASGVTVPAGGSVWSDLASLPISAKKSYIVSYLVSGSINGGSAWQWTDSIPSSHGSSYVIPQAQGPTRADLLAATWSSRAGVVNTNHVLAVQHLFCTYPTNGVYTSAIQDTGMEYPSYTEINWDAAVPSGTDIQLKVRTGDAADMSDAPQWSAVPPVPMLGVIAPGHGRYVQYQSLLLPDASFFLAPKLKAVRVKWRGPERMVDVSGVFGKGPNRGTVEVTVDGRPLVTGLRAELSIFKSYRSYGGKQRCVTSSLVSEVSPRNTGL